MRSGLKGPRMTEKPDGRVGRRVGTRAAILEAATELFAARGVTTTSMDEIAEQAGIAKGSIYYNFSSKAALVEAIMKRSAEILAEALAVGCDGKQGVAVRAAVVEVLLGLVRDHPAAARLMVNELFRTDRSWRESIRSWRQVALSPLINDYQREQPGLPRPIAEVRAAAVVGAALMAGLEWLVFHPERDHAEVSDAVIATFA